ncbi:MAG: thioredoxin family protein [Planctomycetaceae bacterium]|jgi:peroxiredoxin|nr:thioredoxin family protein [Planctomycetaceae bacterium]
MIFTLFRALTLAAVVFGGITAVHAGEFNETLSIGDAAPAWKDLPGTDGQNHGLADVSADKLVAVVFTCNSCPVAVGYEDRLIEFAQRRAEQVTVVAINVNKIPEDSLEKMQQRAEERMFPFSYLFDASQQIAKDYGAQNTPEVILLDRDRKVVYMGALDDSIDATKVEKKYLDAAVDAVLAGNAPETSETLPQGCRIRFEGASRRRKK